MIVKMHHYFITSSKTLAFEQLHNALTTGLRYPWQPQALTFLLSIQRDVALSPPPLVALLHM